MDNEFIIIDQAYKYEVDEVLEGGIGFVRLMSLREFSRRPPEGAMALQYSGEKYPYRNQLAAKTIKSSEGMDCFAKACVHWAELKDTGIVPLLKVVKIGGEILALMPRCAGNLRSLMQSGSYTARDLLRALCPVIASLSKVYTDYRMVHQALKPENILYCQRNQKLVFELSDWGIAGVQACLLPDSGSERFGALDAYGILPYLAPERFDNYISNVRADIFSLGMIVFEILADCLPYHEESSIAEQITSGEYYKKVERTLFEISNEKFVSVVLRMLYPDTNKRMQEYGELLALLDTLL